MLMTARTGIFSDTGDTFLKHTVVAKKTLSNSDV